eukprot:2417522-Prymnesium_polylepis.1
MQKSTTVCPGDVKSRIIARRRPSELLDRWLRLLAAVVLVVLENVGSADMWVKILLWQGAILDHPFAFARTIENRHELELGAWGVRVHASRVERTVFPNLGVVGRLFSKQRLVGIENLILNLAVRLAARKDDQVAARRKDAEGLADDLLPEFGAPGDVPRVLTVRLGAVTGVDDDASDGVVLDVLERVETVGLDHLAVDKLDALGVGVNRTEHGAWVSFGRSV